jgi:cyanophycinase
MKQFGVVTFALALFAFSSIFSDAQTYKYIRLGNKTDAHVASRGGFALMGGGEDLDEAFRWLCNHASGGDLLVLRSHGSDDYNPYIQKLCHLNSVATLIIPSRAAAHDLFVARTIAHASVLFISGGDQGEYVNFWMGTPVQSEINKAIARGIPIGGTSAGLAVLGEWAYSAQGDKPDDPNLDGELAMTHPFSPRVTLVHGFLHIPQLSRIVTDTHFATRNRMGRLLTFLARLDNPAGRLQASGSPPVRGIGIEQTAAVLLDPSGKATVVGHGDAYFIDASKASGTLTPSQPLTYGPYQVQKVTPGHRFNLKTWTGETTHYSLTA